MKKNSETQKKIITLPSPSAKMSEEELQSRLKTTEIKHQYVFEAKDYQLMELFENIRKSTGDRFDTSTRSTKRQKFYWDLIDDLKVTLSKYKKLKSPGFTADQLGEEIKAIVENLFSAEFQRIATRERTQKVININKGQVDPYNEEAGFFYQLVQSTESLNKLVQSILELCTPTLKK